MNMKKGDQKTDTVDLSVIIVNWNTKDLLRNCLNSVYQTVQNLFLEVIVVDNASSDGSVAMLQKEFPSVITIANQENRGFGAANNQALAVMKGRYALLLNSDAVLTVGAVNKLWDFCETNEKVGVAGGQLLNADGSKQNSIASFPSLLTLAVNDSLLEYLFPRIYPSKRYTHLSPIEVDSIVGACMMIKKKAMDQTGFFDERYFFFFEETDLMRTMGCHHWKTYHVPDAFIYHLQGQSVGHNTRSRIQFYRSRYQYFRKWYSPFYFYCAKTIILIRLLVNEVSTFLSIVLTLGLNKNARNKLITYSNMIRWHWEKNN